MTTTTLATVHEVDLPDAVLPRVAAGPAPAFVEIYEAGFPFVWRTLRRLGVPLESLSDAAQDVFLVVHRRLSAFDGTSAVNTWLFGIAMRVARDHRRAAKRKQVHSAPPPPPPDDRDPLERVVAQQTGPLEQCEAAEANRLLLRLLEELDEERRAVFVLTEVEQMSAPEIALALGLNLNTVYGRLRVARQQFNDALVRYRAREQRTTRRVP